MGGLIPEYDTVTKISIVPRSSGAGGLTFFSPLEDRIDNGECIVNTVCVIVRWCIEEGEVSMNVIDLKIYVVV